MNKQLEHQQNFQGEVTSGFIVRLEKQTEENIRLGKQPINNKGEKMSDNIILEKITFNKIDNDGNLITDKNGNEKVFELKNFVDCSWICEGTEEDHLQEIKS